jgi:hypothetical protein
LISLADLAEQRAVNLDFRLHPTDVADLLLDLPLQLGLGVRAVLEDVDLRTLALPFDRVLGADEADRRRVRRFYSTQETKQPAHGSSFRLDL